MNLLIENEEFKVGLDLSANVEVVSVNVEELTAIRSAVKYSSSSIP